LFVSSQKKFGLSSSKADTPQKITDPVVNVAEESRVT
jgi:hypothetical protein